MRLRLLLVLTGFLAAACEVPKAPPRPVTATYLKNEAESTRAQAASAWTPLGLQVEEVPQAALKALGVAYGVMVTKVRAPADRSRILPGDVIVGLNQTRIRSVEEFNSLIADQNHGIFGLLVRRADADLYISLDIPEERLRAPRPARDKLLRT
jgi:C-terminal processing protease CtpA/Prc